MQTWLSFIVVFVAAQSPASNGTLNGRILEEVSGAPIPGVRVTLTTFPQFPGMVPPQSGVPPQPLRSLDATTDPDGRYSFPALAPGHYSLNFQKNGFVVSAPQIAVDIVAGQTTVLPHALQRASVIVGRVLDPSGEPVVDIRVTPVRRIGDRMLPSGQGAQTNDLGEFRLFGLAAGDYSVQASPRPEPRTRPGAAVVPRRTMLATTYFPGVVDSAAAQTFTLAPGQTKDGLSFSLQSVPALTVSGMVVDEKGLPVDDAMVWLMPDRSSMSSFPTGPPSSTHTDGAGRFTITNVQAGRYEVTAGAPVVTQMPSRGSSGGGVVITGGVAGGVGIGSGVVSAGGGAFATEMRNGTTIQYRQDTASRVPLNVTEDMSGLKVVLQSR